MIRLLQALLFGTWIWFVEVTAAPFVLPGAPSSALLVIPADGSRLEQALGGVAPRPSSGTDAAQSPAPLTGRASWYPASGLIAAAGPELRSRLGPDWRGTRVRVCAGDCVVVRLTDFCQCYRGEKRERLVDLSDDAFDQLAPLAAGVVRVRVEPVVVIPPSTDR